VTLHGLGGTHTTMMRPNALDLAEAGGYIYVAPMGYNPRGWYGVPRGERRGGPPPNAAPNTGRQGPPPGALAAANDPPNLRELSEKDVLNVLDIVRKEFNVSLTSNFAFSFWIRGDAKPNDFQFKMVDPPGNNVWWRRRPGFRAPKDWEHQVIRKSRFEFAWGPATGKPLTRVGSIEFAISAGEGGKGSIWIDDLRFEERRPPPRDDSLQVRASTFVTEHDARLAIDGDANTWVTQTGPWWYDANHYYVVMTDGQNVETRSSPGRA